MTPEDLPEIEEREPERRPSTTQFGLLRMLLWMSPGFGAAVLWVCLSDSRFVTFCPDFRQRCWITGAMVAMSIGAFAWLDSLANPSVAKRDGHPTLRALWINIAWFTGGQVVALPPVFLSMMMFAEMAGFHT